MVSPQIRVDDMHKVEGSPVNIWSSMLCTRHWMESFMLISGLLTSSNVDLAQAATHFGPPSNYYAFTCKLEGQVLHTLFLMGHMIRLHTWIWPFAVDCCSHCLDITRGIRMGADVPHTAEQPLCLTTSMACIRLHASTIWYPA